MFKRNVIFTIIALVLFIPYIAQADITGEIVITNETADERITAQLYELYANSEDLSESSLLVNTHEHLVLLSGTVDTFEQYKKAILLAHSINGIQEVNTDNLAVKFSETSIAEFLLPNS
ncbi:MAG: BON domain-containing protein [bacterium]|nr:BON domain-containing protein [bacterium]